MGSAGLWIYWARPGGLGMKLLAQELEERMASSQPPTDPRSCCRSSTAARCTATGWGWLYGGKDKTLLATEFPGNLLVKRAGLVFTAGVPIKVSPAPWQAMQLLWKLAWFIAVPEKVGNLTFGGVGRSVLYIAASSSLYRIILNTAGIQRP